MNIRIGCLSMVGSIRCHYESIIRMHIASLVHGMISPGRISTGVAVRRRLVLRARGKREVHEMSDGRLSLTTCCRSHGGLHMLARIQPQETQIKNTGHLQTRCIPHHPVAGSVSGACAGSSETGYSSENWYSSRSVPRQSCRNLQGAAENRCLLPNGMPAKRIDSGY
jgi:hypothetical protein